jgi:hypothetical protein
VTQRTRTTYFHVSPVVHAAGSVVAAGNWGKATRQFGRGLRSLEVMDDAKTVTWETALELARQTLKPDAPSRLDCVFACTTETDAITFRDRFRKGAQIYEVSVSQETPIYLGDYDVITTFTADGPFLDAWVNRSILYWTSAPIGLVEVVIGGSVNIIRAA